MTPLRTADIRLGEVVAALSIATDLAMGQPLEFALRSCVLSMRLARQLGMSPSEQAQVYYQSLLRYIGCNAETHTMAALFGDELDFRRDFARIDMGRLREMAALIFTYLRRANAQAGALGLVTGVVRGLVVSQKTASDSIESHCEVAERFAERLGLSPEVRRNLGEIYERWDGRGLPRGLKGNDIAPAVRIVSFAQDAIVLIAAFGESQAYEKLEARSGTVYEPALVRMFLGSAQEFLKDLDALTWDCVLALEPAPQARLTHAEFDTACLAMADFADLKSPYWSGHSRAVSALAAEAARRCGLPETDAVDLARAGLLHDIGQVGVPARIWLKTAAFSDSDWEQVRMHTYFSERVLARAPELARLGAIIARHHERLDGSGYHRGARSDTLSVQCRLLAAAEAYQNKLEERPHRRALSADAAASAVRREVREGRLDADAVDAVLAAAGQTAKSRSALAAGLTRREIEVLRAIARGHSAKEIARALNVSPKTIDNHTQSIFAKLGVRTRGGATLYAMEHGLIGAP